MFHRGGAWWFWASGRKFGPYGTEERATQRAREAVAYLGDAPVCHVASPLVN